MKNHKEIFEALLAGKKIRQKEWAEDCYLELNEDGFVFNESGCGGLSVYLPDDFEIYEPPKEKVKLYQWAYGITPKNIFISDKYCASEEDFLNWHGSSKPKFYKRLDHTCIEVER